jgi:hypothetical protein
MSERYLDAAQSTGRNGDPFAIESSGFDRAPNSAIDIVTPGEVSPGQTGDAGPMAPAVREQLAREFADIEQAKAALQNAAPDLESWNEPAGEAAPKPRPLWLLIGVIWFSTALVTAGAVVAIVSLAG